MALRKRPNPLPFVADSSATLQTFKSFLDVQAFRILYFRDSLLEQAEEVRTRDVVAAIERASGKPPHIRAEVWSDRGRIAEIGTGPSPLKLRTTGEPRRAMARAAHVVVER